jgi:phosphoserine aminotransferase
MAHILNFYPGPEALPLQAMEEARDELLDRKKTGISVLEMSHR